ncbi:hypothetical protein [Streptomyces hokutonensis]|uniref:hypothetical protein n=1 Tax=Streptomyces hokutonensis TaxID=1306990 RepID=UPI00131A261D|nr:hypothetical protein [Streptomyces hokutonensis]
MRRGVRTGIGAGVVAVLLGAGAGLWVAFAGEGHPFGDARVCEGSEIPLQAALDVVRLPLSAGAKDVHYVTYSPTTVAAPVSVAVAFRVSGAAMDRYLRANGIVPAGVDRLTNGPYATGDSGTDPASLGLCGGVKEIFAPSVLVDKQVAAEDGTLRSVDFAVALPDGYDSLPATTDVLLTVAANH